MVMAAKGGATTKVRDMLFEDWWMSNVVAVEGGALEQASIYRAYRRDMDSRNALGVQGFERMLNQLRVKRSVRQGKAYRLGVGFKVAAQGGARGVVETKCDLRIPVEADWGGVSPPSAAPSVTAQGAAPPPPAAPVSSMLRIANAPGAPESLLLAIPDASDGTSYTATAMRDVLNERLRQRLPVGDGGEGFDAAHDDASDPGAHERAAACYAYAAGQDDRVAAFVETNAKSPREGRFGRFGWFVRDTLVMMWPWPHHFWKPKTDQPDWKRRCMVIAGALIVAAIERYDRDKARQALADSQASQMTGV